MGNRMNESHLLFTLLYFSVPETGHIFLCVLLKHYYALARQKRKFKC